MVRELRSTFQRDAHRERIRAHAHEVLALRDCSLLSVIPGTWGSGGGTAKDRLGGTALVHSGEERVLIGLRRIIQSRRYTMKSTDPYRNASGAPADEKVDVSDTC